MTALCNFAGKLQFLMHSFQKKVRCGMSINAQLGFLQGPVGSVGFMSVMIPKQLFCDTVQKKHHRLQKVELVLSICQYITLDLRNRIEVIGKFL